MEKWKNKSRKEKKALKLESRENLGDGIKGEQEHEGKKDDRIKDLENERKEELDDKRKEELEDEIKEELENERKEELEDERKEELEDDTL